MKTIQINGTELAWVEAGEGQTVVLVHGALGDFRIWQSQMAPFARHYRTIALSLRSHYPGQQPARAEDFPFGHAADLVTFLQQVARDPVHLVGHSAGGAIGAVVAVRQPELLRSLTLCEPALFSLLMASPQTQPLLRGVQALAQHLANMAGLGMLDASVKIFINAVCGPDGYGNLPESARAVFTDNARTLLPMLLGGLKAEPFTAEMARAISCPTLLVEGAISATVFRATIQKLAECLANSETRTLPRTGHALHLENPEAFHQAVLPFLQCH